MSDQPFDIESYTVEASTNEDFAADLWPAGEECSIEEDPLESFFSEDDQLVAQDLMSEDIADDSGLWDYDAYIYPEGDDAYADDTAAWGDLPYEGDYADESGLWDYDAYIYPEGDDAYADDSGLWDYDAYIYPEGDDAYADDTAAWGDLPYEADYAVDDWSYYADDSGFGYTDYAVDDWSYWEGDSYYEPSGDGWYGEGDYTMFNVDGMTGMYGPGTTGEDLVHDLS